MFFFFSATLGAELSADVSTLFDVGAIFGAIIAGVISDYSGMSACTCAGMLIFAVPMVCKIIFFLLWKLNNFFFVHEIIFFFF